jgi:tRNA uridine 5-carboxymethylaminomethyl modification enzyme
VKQRKKYDLIVVGGGHAGVEASHIAAHLGCSVLLITMDSKAIGRMSCNPAIGGLAKGQIVREIDMLGGLMGKFADNAGIQFKILNRSKGRSVWSPRAQVDKRLYEKFVINAMQSTNNIDIIDGEVVNVLVSNYRVDGVTLRDRSNIYANSVVLTCGTFLSGKIHIGDRKIFAGRMGEGGSIGITESLCSLGFKSGRLKTGTPPRLISSTINWDNTEISSGDSSPTPFSYSTQEFNPPNEPCHTTRTNLQTHSVIKENLNKSPMFSGEIDGVGPRYCPSVEDKIHRFSHHDSHILFLEPEWLGSDQIYLNGFSTSLPEDVQLDALRHIPALKNVEFFRPGYAIEYDFFPPAQLRATLETKDVAGLFLSGQINGTSGYEEAAAQGLVAGINAYSYIYEKESLVLGRSSSYIGVMVDDLITKDTLEPYRMFTSRAEYRLMIRYSNTDERLLKISEKMGLLNPSLSKIINSRLLEKERVRSVLNVSIQPDSGSGIKNLKQATPAKELLKRPECSIFNMGLDFSSEENNDSMPAWAWNEILLDVEAEIKYAGYIKRHIKEIEKHKNNEFLPISKMTNYSTFCGLSNEAVEKLTFVRPETLGQAMRVSGITPVDISVLLVNLSK